jgi:UDP-GlcNAc3NAcA epimerase
MKIITVVGARPQFVKAAALSRALKEHPSIEELIVHTGQHFDENMSDIFFEEMEIPQPSYHLNINSLNHGAMTGRMIEQLELTFLSEKPNLVLVFGDTNSTLAAAIAASKLHIPIAHVEAGLRSFNMQMPEEINRILTDRIARFLYCPTQQAINNLKVEGFDAMDNEVVLCGDVMEDAALYYAKHSSEKSSIIGDIALDKFVLCTLHRAENTDKKEKMQEIVNSLNLLHEEIPVVIPLHPRTKNVLEQYQLQLNVKTISPQGYFGMLELLKHCKMVITDSGGLQKEAYFFQKPCVTIRDQTEWIELIESGVNILGKADQKDLKEKFHQMLSFSEAFPANLYGGGKAAQSIANHLASLSI